MGGGQDGIDSGKTIVLSRERMERKILKEGTRPAQGLDIVSWERQFFFQGTQQNGWNGFNKVEKRPALRRVQLNDTEGEKQRNKKKRKKA